MADEVTKTNLKKVPMYARNKLKSGVPNILFICEETNQALYLTTILINC